MQLTLLAALALGASTKEPCVEAIAEFAAYETLLRSDEFFPLASGSLNSPIPMKFGSADAWEPVYYSIRARIDALAALAAERPDDAVLSEEGPAEAADPVRIEGAQ